jgi:hypothetical protein
VKVGQYFVAPAIKCSFGTDRKKDSRPIRAGNLTMTEKTPGYRPSPPILFLLRARLKFLQFGKYISDEDIGFNSQWDSIIVV